MSHRRSPAVLAGALLTLCAVTARAGSLDAPAAPTAPGSALYTLEDVYNRLSTNTQGTKRAGSFTEPAAAPAPTGHTLDEVYAKAIPTQVPKTGQTTSYATGDDGDLEKGVAWPNPRFTDNGNGTVTDNLSGLIWLKNANCRGTRDWTTALNDANTLADGTCSLTDGSSAGSWRLPNIKELQSLVDFGRYNPVLPSGHPFSGVQTGNYWSSTAVAGYTSVAWYLNLYDGPVSGGGQSVSYFVWPVRGGQ
jgi:hypothetical protein